MGTPSVLHSLLCRSFLIFAFRVLRSWFNLVGLSIEQCVVGSQQKCAFFFKFVAVIELLLVLLVLLVFSSLRDTPLAGIFIVLPFPKHSRLLGLFSRINIFLRLPFPLKLNKYLKSPSFAQARMAGLLLMLGVSQGVRPCTRGIR